MSPTRYRSAEEDSARWLTFPFRRGDVVISTRSKSGTTWMQQICVSLVLGTAQLPAGLAEISPWIDWLVEPYDAILARLEAQTARRVVKTHTPLDGVVLDPRATYLVVARHPLDLAVSLYHQGENLDRERIQELTGIAPPPARPPLREWLLRWIAREVDPHDAMDSLPGVMHHLCDAWARRGEPNVHLVHYADLLGDLEAQMRRIADVLGVDVDTGDWPALVEAASFDAMRADAEQRAPDRSGVLKDPAAFFRRGRSGDGSTALTSTERAEYERRVAGLAPPDLLDWLHR